MAFGGREPFGDPLLKAVATAARSLDSLRRLYLDPPDATPEQLAKRTLTGLYNTRPTWLAQAHAALDRAVWAAYGWTDDPSQTTDEMILERLLELNRERAGIG